MKLKQIEEESGIGSCSGCVFYSDIADCILIRNYPEKKPCGTKVWVIDTNRRLSKSNNK